MRKIMMWTGLLSAVCLFALTAVYGQTTTVEATKVPTVNELLQWEAVIFAAIINIAGYFSSRIPILKNINQMAFRVLAIALIIGGVLFVSGFAEGWQLVLGYLAATNIYDLIFSWLLGKTKKAAS